MANVHRQYDIKDDAYYVRVEGEPTAKKFTGLGAEKASRDYLKTKHMEECRKSPSSRVFDHANHT